MLIFKELNKETVIIDPFQVPLDLEKQNITGQAIVNKLIDQIEIIKEKADTSYKNLDFKPVFFDSQLEIVIPGSGISLKSLLQNFKNFLGKKQTRISGEVVLIGGKVFLTIRVMGEPSKTYSGEISELDNILKDAAQYVLIFTQPYILAYYLYYNYEDNKEEALEIIQFTLSHDPKDDDAMAYTLDGSIKYDEGKFEESIKLYKKAIEIDPEFTDAYNGWAYSLFEMKKYDEAEKIYKKALEIDPHNAYTFDYWAIMLDELGKPEEAFDMFKKAIQYAPDNTEFINEYGVSLLKNKKYPEALEMFDKAIELDPKNSDGYFNKANLLYETQNFKESLSNYVKATELNSKNVKAYINASKILSEQGNFKEAKEMLLKASEQNPKSLMPYFELGKMMETQINIPEAISMYNESINRDSSKSDIYKSLGNLYEEEKKFKEAEKLYKKAVRQSFPDSVYFENKINELVITK